MALLIIKSYVNSTPAEEKILKSPETFCGGFFESYIDCSHYLGGSGEYFNLKDIPYSAVLQE